MMEALDEQSSGAKIDQRYDVGKAGASGECGQALRGGSAAREEWAGVSRSFALSQSHGKSVARSAARVGLLACDLHALPTLGRSRSLAAALEKFAGRTLCRGPWAVRGFDHGASPSACRRGAKKKGPEQALGRSRGGYSTKIHAATIDENCGVALHLTPGEAHDGRQFECLYESLDPDNVLEAAALDKGYDADRIRERLTLDGIEPVIPPISTRSKKLPYDKERYRRRNHVERFFNKLKQFRRIATRYDKLRATFFAAVCLVAAFLIARNSWTLPKPQM
jgi:putative transposase